MSRRLPIFVILLCGVSLIALNCGPRGLESKPYKTPRAFVFTPESPASSPVSIQYYLLDVGFRRCSIEAEFSSDDGASWNPCTPVSSADINDLPSASHPGINHAYQWDATADQFTAGGQDVIVRLSPSANGDAGTPGKTREFTAIGYWTGTGTGTGTETRT
ncbi:MAG: hypothetical protein E3J72_07755 [Planctomycetota bacterium]|nr:MAG: hypothetical protein E3J72_07755 [Planctomycetota bacterium]